MGTVYAVVNQKGGVGKTTTAVNLAAYLAIEGRRTLLVDLDPQGNATSGLGIDRGGLETSTYDVVVEEAPAQRAILETAVPNLSILPATLDLAGADARLMAQISREGFLRSALEPVREEYEFILIDGPPSLGLLTLNALVACDLMVIPIQAEYYALEGISQLLKTIDLVKRNLNPALDIGIVLLTMHDARVRLSQQVVDEVRSFFGDKVSKAVIPRNVRLSEAPSHGLPVALYDSKSKGAQAYRAVAMEILTDGKARSR